MNYNYQTYKYESAERQAKVSRQQMLSNRHQENRGNHSSRRR